MVKVQLNGGLGNQLFQYAAAKSLAFYHKVPLKLDISSFYRTKLPELEVPRAFELYNFKGITDETYTASQSKTDSFINIVKNKSLLKILPNHKRRLYIEPFFHYDPSFFRSRKDVILKGQWQSEKYFSKYQSFFQEAFVLKNELVKNVESTGTLLRHENSVSVHVRRSDYLRMQIILEWHGVMNKEYYQKGFEILDQKFVDYKVYYFTDDPEWVRKELLPIKEGEILSQTISKTHYEDFYLMQHCRHNIIANSSFSWWAAWLNSNPDKIVIAPKNWFNNGPKDTQDLLPESWLAI